MSLPEPILDNLRFQADLVDEARRRIIRYCPEWTDYNLSDPGITLIELFAWMTELMVYRLNQVPEKNYLRFLDLLGLKLKPARSAAAELTFYLSTPFPISPDDETVAMVPAGTEVATRLTGEEPEVVFTTDARLVIRPPRLTQLRSDVDFHKNYLLLPGSKFSVFRETPALGDQFYLGFDEAADLAGHIVRLSFQAEATQGVGVNPKNPPLAWECSLGAGAWAPLEPERDTTSGLNRAEGEIVFHLPLDLRPDLVQGVSASWLRCRLHQTDKDQGMYNQSPRLVDRDGRAKVRAVTLGATTRAAHARVVQAEGLGTSSGEPGQTYQLQQAPVLKPSAAAGEVVEVEERRDGEVVFVPWQLVDDFSASARYDRHFTLDTSTGEVAFGPAIRQADGRVAQYGRVPEAGRAIRIARYRHGGGVAGNVPAGRVQVLKTAIAYIDQVANRKPAQGGRDAETLDEAKLRARREMRAQQRAVTAEDYEVLARDADRAVARVKCLTPDQRTGTVPPGMVEVLIVPAAADAVAAGRLGGLVLTEALARQVADHLDKYRLITTSVRVREPRYVGLKVTAEIVAAETSQPAAVAAAVTARLRQFLSPLVPVEKTDSPNAAPPAAGDGLEGRWEGWPFGRPLYVSEIYSLIQAVPGVKHVLGVQLGQRPVLPAEAAREEDQFGEAAPATAAALAPVNERRLDLPPDTLLCSLDHAVNLVEL